MNSYFLEKAMLNEPIIYKKTIEAVRFGVPVSDESAWFQYRFEERPTPEAVMAGDSFYIDFGDHYTGHLSFRMCLVERYPDSPVKVHIKFAENLYELESDYDAYEDGLTASWLQQEILYIDSPGVIRLPRRYAFRYIKFTMDPKGFCGGVMDFRDFKITSLTSAKTEICEAVNCDDARLCEIDRIGCKTLKECMQRVFEDGPKRDRRLWVGDLRIQALTGYYTYPTENTMKLVRKCLYLFAAHTEPGCRCRQCIFENETGSYSEPYFLTDYALLFAVTLCDYYEHTGDSATVDDLFAVADEQLRIAWEDSEDNIVKDRKGWWTHIDWCPDLERVTSLQGVLLYTLGKMIELCQATGRTRQEEEYRTYQQMFCKAAREKLYDPESGFFCSSYDNRQLSLHSQVWMVLGGVIKGKEARELLSRILENKEAKGAVSPYMHHYVLEAMLLADMKEEALDYIKSYWGAMVEHGADTYWEVFVPDDFYASPYQNLVMNTTCHAWSCSASYFIRKYYNVKGEN